MEDIKYYEPEQLDQEVNSIKQDLELLKQYNELIHKIQKLK